MFRTSLKRHADLKIVRYSVPRFSLLEKNIPWEKSKMNNVKKKQQTKLTN